MERARRDQQEEAPALRISVDSANEQVVLASALVDDATREQLTRKLKPEHFFEETHKKLWRALQEMQQRRLAYDPATFQRLVNDPHAIDYAWKLIELRPVVAENLGFHLQMLEWDRTRAHIATGPLATLLQALQDPKQPPERVRALARHVSQAFEHQVGAHTYDAHELVRDIANDLAARMEGRACYPFGIKGLDNFENDRRRLIPGAAPEQITVLTGVPGSGKTTLAARVTLGLRAQGRRVGYAAWEMGGQVTLETLSALDLELSRTNVQEGRITKEQAKAIAEHAEELAKDITIFKNPFRRGRGTKPTNESNLDAVHQMLVDSGCDVVVFDLWKRCLVDARPEHEEEALYRQQAMLAETKAHGILLQQQRSKDIEQREDKRPTREGIKGSSAWTEVADTIIGVHRPALWKRIDDQFVEVFVLKQRYGRWPLGVEFAWDGDLGSITGGRSIDYEQPGAASDMTDFMKVGKAKPSKDVPPWER